MEGVEPPRLAALGSKPSVSTSSTTSPHAKALYILLISFGKVYFYLIKGRKRFRFFFSFEDNINKKKVITLLKKYKQSFGKSPHK